MIEEQPKATASIYGQKIVAKHCLGKHRPERRVGLAVTFGDVGAVPSALIDRVRWLGERGEEKRKRRLRRRGERGSDGTRRSKFMPRILE